MSPDVSAKTVDSAPWDWALPSMRLVTPLSRFSQVQIALTWMPQLLWMDNNYECMHVHVCTAPTPDHLMYRSTSVVHSLIMKASILWLLGNWQRIPVIDWYIYWYDVLQLLYHNINHSSKLAFKVHARTHQQNLLTSQYEVDHVRVQLPIFRVYLLASLQGLQHQQKFTYST